VHAGGGLLLLGETEEDKYGSNLNALAGRFGVTITNATVSDYEAHGGAPHWVLADLAAPGDGVDLLARVDAACFYRAATLELEPARARALARAGRASSAPGAPLLAVAEHGAGRVVVAADSDLFGDDCLGSFSHVALWTNLVTWAAAGAFAQPLPEIPSPLAADPAWTVLKEEVEILRALQEPDGSVDLDRHAAEALHGHVDVIAGAVGALAVHVPHQAAYVEAVVGDLRRWADAGFGTPDFGPSLEAFRPDRDRRDGIEHLVLFPMYKQNGSRDKVFEALVVRVPWPAWLAELEAGRYDNAKFVPVTLVDFTSGYDSDCAVLFPETVSVAGRPANHFGGIFCDREAARFRRTSSEAAAVLRPQPAARRGRAPGLRGALARRLRAVGPRSTTARTPTATCRSTRS
jgi:hypothetical protein